MVDPDSPQQAIVAWKSRSKYRDFWIESLEGVSILAVMRDNNPILSPPLVSRAKVFAATDAQGRFRTGLIDELLKKVLEQWEKQFGNLA